MGLLSAEKALGVMFDSAAFVYSRNLSLALPLRIRLTLREYGNKASFGKLFEGTSSFLSSCNGRRLSEQFMAVINRTNTDLHAMINDRFI